MSEQFERRRPPRFLADLLNSHVDFHTLYKAVLKHKDTIKLNRLVYMSSFNLQAHLLLIFLQESFCTFMDLLISSFYYKL